jgi:hypothetical protein
MNARWFLSCRIVVVVVSCHIMWIDPKCVMRVKPIGVWYRSLKLQQLFEFLPGRQSSAWLFLWGSEQVTFALSQGMFHNRASRRALVSESIAQGMRGCCGMCNNIHSFCKNVPILRVQYISCFRTCPQQNKAEVAWFNLWNPGSDPGPNAKPQTWIWPWISSVPNL